MNVWCPQAGAPNLPSFHVRAGTHAGPLLWRSRWHRPRELLGRRRQVPHGLFRRGQHRRARHPLPCRGTEAELSVEEAADARLRRTDHHAHTSTHPPVHTERRKSLAGRWRCSSLRWASWRQRCLRGITCPKSPAAAFTPTDNVDAQPSAFHFWLEGRLQLHLALARGTCMIDESVGEIKEAS